MGDRVTVVFKNDQDTNNVPFFAALYFHNLGDGVTLLLQQAAKFWRRGDASYAAARTCGVYHAKYPGVLSLGIIEGPTDLTEETLEEYSPGDAGVVVVDINTGKMEAFGGYMVTEDLPTLEIGQD